MFIDFLYLELTHTIELQQGETKTQYKLFLHILYEVESAFYYLNTLVLSERDKICETLRREVNKEKRSWEKVYFELNFNEQFEKLLTWFHRRSQGMEIANTDL